MKNHLSVLALFIVLALVMTYPLSVRPGTAVRDYGDSLFNTWILAWDVHQITHANIAHFFDANIFYPHVRTLAYSEHLFTESLFALPIALLSGNPVLAHNIILLLGLITSAFGMFLLVRYLTGKILPAVVAGFIYAFNPFMFAHLFQVQVLWAGGIPLAFLFLHRYFDHGRRSDLLLFALFFVLQVLANGYYALFLGFFVGLFLLIKAVQKKKIFKVRFWADMALAGVLIVATAGPFAVQYVKVQKEMGFQRDIGVSASPKSFFATASINRIYGRATARNLLPEGELFPGAVAVLLAVAGVVFGLRRKKTDPASPKTERRGWPHVGLWILSALTLVTGAVVCLILFTGGFNVRLGFLGQVRAHAPQRSLILLVLLLVAGALWRKAWRVRLFPFTWKFRAPLTYVAFLILSFSFTFGAKGPYVLLYKYLPGFNGIRVPARFQVIVMFTLAVLAAYGMMFLSEKWKKGIVFLAAAVPVLILAEYFSCPLPVQPVPTPGMIPSVYRWLGSFPPGSFAVVEIPFPNNDSEIAPLECPRAFFSSFHFQKLLNGYSGFFPPVYDELKSRWTRFPILENVADYKTLGVKYMIFHSELLDPEMLRAAFDAFEARKDEFRFAGLFDDDYVYEILGARMLSDRAGPRLFSQGYRRLSPSGWKATASVNGEIASRAIDGQIQTRWDSAGPQKKGQSFVLDLGQITRVSGLGLRLGSSDQDYPRAYTVELSADGIAWHTVASTDRTVISILSFLDPKNLSVDIAFPDEEARFVRVTNQGVTEIFFWSIHELEVYASGPQPGTAETR